MEEDTKGHNHDGVVEKVIASFADDEAARRQPEIVDVEHHHHQEWRHTTHQVVQEGCPVAAKIGPRRQEHEAPDTYMKEDVQFPIHVG